MNLQADAFVCHRALFHPYGIQGLFAILLTGDKSPAYSLSSLSGTCRAGYTPRHLHNEFNRLARETTVYVSRSIRTLSPGEKTERPLGGFLHRLVFVERECPDKFYKFGSGRHPEVVM